MVKFVLVFLFLNQYCYSVPIGITQVSDLNFGPAAIGDPLEIVPPGTGETPSNASFDITGDPSTSYTITLPSFIEMSLDGSGSGQKIRVDTFKSYPAAGANGSLDVSGKQTLFVGATRVALAVGLIAGNYSATFTVDVIY